MAAAPPTGFPLPEPALRALRRLREGNERACSGRQERLGFAPAGSSPVDGQWPVAALLTCADSRISPEAVFDFTSGTLFTVRNAGNIVNDEVLGSLEFATGDLRLPLIVVLGHTHCAAVAAAAETVRTGVADPSWRGVSVAKIIPAIAQAPASSPLTDLVTRNVAQSARTIPERSGPVAARIAAGNLGIVTAVLDLATGAVTWLPAGTVPGTEWS